MPYAISAKPAIWIKTKIKQRPTAQKVSLHDTAIAL